MTNERKPALSAYQKRLFAFLSVATFFEGYDFIALTQILPNLRANLGIGRDAAGVLITVINFGTVIAYLLIRNADRWGRRRVLTVTIAGYTTFTFLSGLAPDVVVFGLTQMLARIFLVGEWATSMVIAAEEFPHARRGMVIGVIHAFSSLGSIVCAGLVPVMLKSPYGWRTVYFVAILPLVVLAYARRGLRETKRFEQEVAHSPKAEASLFAIFKTPYRKRVVELGAIWFFSYIAAQNAVTFWKDFAVNERALTDAQVGRAIVIAALVSMPLVFSVGKMMDVIGRRGSAGIIFGIGAASTFLLYSVHGYVALTGALVLGIFSASAHLPLLNAFTTELFPTNLRGVGFAWSNNLIGRAGYMLSPLVVGYFAQELGWGPVIRVTAVFPIITALLIYWLLPETRARPLEETASL